MCGSVMFIAMCRGILTCTYKESFSRPVPFSVCFASFAFWIPVEMFCLGAHGVCFTFIRFKTFC